MLSRVAEQIFWMGRYIERAENVARFIEVNKALTLDQGGNPESNQWLPLVATTGDDEEFEKKYGEANEENVIRFLAFDKENPNSILSCITMARENARSIRETISSEMWAQLNNFYWMVKSKSEETKLSALPDFFSEVVQASHLFVGLTDVTMTHGEGWHFVRLGRLLERADKTARILDVKYFLLLPSVEYVDSPLDTIVWGALLRSASAFEMYRKKFHRIESKKVVEFLVFDEQFPRSINYCVRFAMSSLKKINAGHEIKNEAEKELATLKKMMEETDAEKVIQNGLHEFIDLFQYNLNVVGNSIFESYFAPKSLPKSIDARTDSQQ